MHKIVVAGAGHGGITAAMNLAKNGWDVTVVEKSAREELGHDWDDTMNNKIIEKVGFEDFDNENFKPYISACFNNPNKKVQIPTGTEPLKSISYIDRKILINSLIDEAIKVGVKFRFNTEALCAIIHRDTVTGLTVKENGIKEDIFADAVIDASGMNSVVRQSLPWSFGVDKKIDKKDVFYVYRAYFEKTEKIEPEHNYNIYFFHCNNPGMDWVISGENYIDILVGGFGGLTQDAIDNAIADFKEEYPYFSDKILRGGDHIYQIPLRKALSKFVCNGYAAVGDSASMIEPLSGSGITMSLGAGKILADTLLDADGDFSVATMWKYEYRFFKEIGEKWLTQDILKNFLSSLTAEDIDYLFDNKFLTANELGKDKGNMNAKMIFEKIQCIATRLSLLKPLAKVGASMAKLKFVCANMPAEYNADKVEKWMKIYSDLD